MKVFPKMLNYSWIHKVQAFNWVTKANLTYLSVFQRTTYVWQQPLQCYGGETLPSQNVSACVTLDFWLKFGVSTGTIAALLLVGISCYFWKKTRKWDNWASHFLSCLLKRLYVKVANKIKTKPKSEMEWKFTMTIFYCCYPPSAGCSISTPSWRWPLGVKSVSCPLQTAVQ